jgi:pyrimidine-specific ribonucleoside hydrolase
MNRREFVASAMGAACISLTESQRSLGSGPSQARLGKVAVVDVTDLYHPYQDPGDNVDLIHAYALPEIDLQAVILDVTAPFRLPVANDRFLWHDPNGPREPGIVPVVQLNSIFDRRVSYAVSPYTPMTSMADDMRSVPKYQQAGIDLLLDLLQKSREQVEIVSFGSCRVIAAAVNRDPHLFEEKVRCIHVSAGSTSRNVDLGRLQEHNPIPGGEWNVALDPHAFRRLLTSNLNIALYPCASDDDPFSYSVHNTYWCLPDLHFIRGLDLRIRNYLIFVFGRQIRADFLQVLNSRLDEALTQDRLNSIHHVWETAVWLNVSGRKVVYRDEHWQVIRASEVSAEDKVLKNDLEYCNLSVRGDARISFELTGRKSHIRIFSRGDPKEYEKAMREAWPAFWQSFKSEADA